MAEVLHQPVGDIHRRPGQPGDGQQVVDGAGSGQPSAQAGCGFGLTGMGERIEGLGGEFATGRAAGGGFRIEARLPAMPSKTFEESVHEQ